MDADGQVVDGVLELAGRLSRLAAMQVSPSGRVVRRCAHRVQWAERQEDEEAARCADENCVTVASNYSDQAHHTAIRSLPCALLSSAYRATTLTDSAGLMSSRYSNILR